MAHQSDLQRDTESVNVSIFMGVFFGVLEEEAAEEEILWYAQFLRR